MKRKTIQEQVGQILQGRPVIGSATAEAIAVKREGMKGKGHKKVANKTSAKTMKAARADLKMVAKGLALAKRIEEASDNKREWILAFIGHSSVQLRDVVKGVKEFYEHAIGNVRTHETIEGALSIGGSKAKKVLEVRRSEVTGVLDALRRAAIIREDGESEVAEEVETQIKAAPSWNGLYALSVQIKREANDEPLTIAAAKAATDKVFRDRQNKPMTDSEATKWISNGKRFTAATSPAELFRLLQTVVRVACITPGVAKFADVRKLAESVKLQKLLTKHVQAQVHAIDVKRVQRDQDRKAA